VSELEETWELALAQAEQRARNTGRRDIANYLALRQKNDLLRRAAIDWLVAALTEMAARANRSGASIQIEEKTGHRFHVGNTTMVGNQLILRRGVRTLTIETGWPRTPGDGIMRGGGLAHARLKHFGRSRVNAEFLLVRSPNGTPQWLVLEKDDRKSLLTEAKLHNHFSILTTES
jgi:hypothetical protein